MNIIAVDDERQVLNMLAETIKDVQPDADVTGFTASREALEFAQGTRVDVAFLDIHIDEMDGLTLAKHLKDIYSATNIIFATAHPDFARDAMALRASGYVLKPVRPERVKEELENLRNPVSRSGEGLYIRTFGNFEVFVNGQVLRFPRAKSKEVLAFLVHKRGTGCSMRELAAALEEESVANVKKYVSDMIKTLKEHGFANAVVKTYNSAHIDVSNVECDLFRFLGGDASAVNEYMGEYMAQYSWAEFFIGHLNDVKYGGQV